MNEKQCVKRKIISFELLRMLSTTRCSYWKQEEDGVDIHCAAVCNFSRVPTVSRGRSKVYKTSPPPGDWTSEERTLCCTSGSHASILFYGNLSRILMFFC